jgi:hypothetical protein
MQWGAPAFFSAAVSFRLASALDLRRSFVK